MVSEMITHLRIIIKLLFYLQRIYKTTILNSKNSNLVMSYFLFTRRGSKLRCASALVSVEAYVSIRPFTLRQRSLALRQIPVAESMLLALYLRHHAGTSLGPFSFPLPALPGVFCPAGLDHCESPVANLRSQHLPFTAEQPLPSRTSRSFGIYALRPAPSGKTCHRGLPDLLSLPVALQ
jgi:hypothetical protein